MNGRILRSLVGTVFTLFRKITVIFYIIFRLQASFLWVAEAFNSPIISITGCGFHGTKLRIIFLKKIEIYEFHKEFLGRLYERNIYRLQDGFVEPNSSLTDNRISTKMPPLRG